MPSINLLYRYGSNKEDAKKAQTTGINLLYRYGSLQLLSQLQQSSGINLLYRYGSGECLSLTRHSLQVSISYIGMVVKHLVFNNIITPSSCGVKFLQTQKTYFIQSISISNAIFIIKSSCFITPKYRLTKLRYS